MIKKEHIRDAIKEIAQRDSAAGYSLFQMLDQGLIDVPSQRNGSSSGNYFYFLFADQEVPVSKFLFFNEGTVPIEQALLVKYGELVGKEALERDKRGIEYRNMSGAIRQEGLRFMVRHEIDYAAAQVKRRAEYQEPVGTASRQTSLISYLDKIKRNMQPLNPSRLKAQSVVWYQGIVGSGTVAYFAPFPYCMTGLVQVAELNLEFFHVRFLLDCLIRGLESNVFVCLVEGQIVGLVFIGVEPGAFSAEIEIKYIATVSSSPNREVLGDLGSLRGIGTFLVSGVWLLGKSELGGVKSIFLDSEIAARTFYQSLGFQPRGLSGYVLKSPEGHLFRSILTMANKADRLTKGAVREVNAILIKQIKSLRKQPKDEKERGRRNIIIECLKECLRPGANPEISTAIIRGLQKYRNRIPEAEGLVQFGLEQATMLRRPAKKRQPVLIVHDERFKLHLDGVAHLESPRRIVAVDEVLQDPSLDGKWVKVEPAPASLEDLALVHTPEYIKQVADSEDKRLTSFDIDTQATAKSYEVARLAAGGVCTLLREIWSGRGTRGFAFVRPPGHHATRDRAMGFCLFNNVAIGARYFIERLGAQRVMIVDIDVHHGNGTQDIFYDTDQVLYTSIHQFPSYPGTGNLGEVGIGKGEGFSVNVPLRKGYGDSEICRVIHFIINPLAVEYSPNMILVSCGFDLYMYDRLGGMRVTPKGYALITSLLVETAEKASEGRIAFVLEGGYSVKGIRECGLRVMQELCGVKSVDQNQIHRIKDLGQGIPSFLKKTIEVHKKYWKVLS